MCTLKKMESLVIKIYDHERNKRKLPDGSLGDWNLRPAVIHVLKLCDEIPSLSDNSPVLPLKISQHLPSMACSMKPPDPCLLTNLLQR